MKNLNLKIVCVLCLFLMGCVADLKQNTIPASIKSKTEANIELEKTMAYARFVPEREDDFAWENDKVAFRVYGPSSSGVGANSGVDAWFKRVEFSIIDKWYAGHVEGISYHEDHGEGYDRYHTGTSRGVGGTAIWIEGKAYPASTFDAFEVLQSGNDVAQFSLEYAWDTPLGKITESKTVTLKLGEQLNHVKSTFTLNGEPAVLPVAIGLTTHDEAADVYSNAENSRISTWETIDGKGVGTGVLLNTDQLTEVVHSVSEIKDESHIWLTTSTDSNGELSFSAGFAWQAAGEFAAIEPWNTFLDQHAK